VAKLSNAAELGPLGEVAGDLTYRGQWGGWCANTNALNAAGSYYGFIGIPQITGTEGSAIDGGGRRKTYATAAAVGANAGIASQAVFFRRANIFAALIKFRLDTAFVSGQIRSFIGITDQTLANMLAQDWPTGGASANFLGLILRSTDSVWQWVSRGGTVTSLLTTGIAPTTGDMYVRISQVGGSNLVTSELLDANFALLHSRTAASSLPGTTTDLGYAVGAQSLDGAAKTISTHYGQFVSRGV
jgi:hypothetical protein